MIQSSQILLRILFSDHVDDDDIGIDLDLVDGTSILSKWILCTTTRSFCS